MENEEPSKLSEAVKRALIYPESTATQDMKYCMIANLGVVGLDTSERAEVYVKNPSLDSTAGMIKYVESGLSNDIFACHVADVLQNHYHSGRISDLREDAEGCFSVRVSPSAISAIKENFPSNKMTFMAFEEPIAMQDVLKAFAVYIKTPNMVQPCTHLDA